MRLHARMLELIVAAKISEKPAAVPINVASKREHGDDAVRTLLGRPLAERPAGEIDEETDERDRADEAERLAPLGRQERVDRAATGIAARPRFGGPAVGRSRYDNLRPNTSESRIARADAPRILAVTAHMQDVGNRHQPKGRPYSYAEDERAVDTRRRHDRTATFERGAHRVGAARRRPCSRGHPSR